MSFPRYPKYKDSGVEWLGEAPAHWKTSTVRWLTQRYSGGTPDRTNLSYWENGTIPWLNSGAVNARLITAPSTYITAEAFASSSAKWVPQGALVIALAGQGKTKGMVAQLSLPATCNQSMAALVPGPEINPRFLFWWLDSNYENVRNMAGGDLRDGLNLELLGDIRCPLPPMGEQRAVAAFLDQDSARIAALVAEQRRLMELLKEKRQAVISHAVTRGLNPDAPMKPSGIEWLGDVPAHWETKRIGHFANVLRGKFTHRPRNDPDFYDGEFPFIQTGDITGAARLVTTFKQTLNDRGAAVSKEFPKGTLVMAIAANIGDVAILDFPAYFPDSIVGLLPKPGVELMFLYYLMIGMKQPMLMAATVSTQMNLNIDQVCALAAGCPPLDEQVQVVRRLDIYIQQIDTLTAEAQRAIDLLQERRKALISAAVTGQIDVRELQPA